MHGYRPVVFAVNRTNRLPRSEKSPCCNWTVESTVHGLMEQRSSPVWTLHPRHSGEGEGQGRAGQGQGRAGQGRAGQGRAGGRGQGAGAGQGAGGAGAGAAAWVGAGAGAGG